MMVKKREYYYSFLFGRYNDTFNKRLFFLRKNINSNSIQEEYMSRACSGLYDSVHKKKKLNFLLLPTEQITKMIKRVKECCSEE